LSGFHSGRVLCRKRKSCRILARYARNQFPRFIIQISPVMRPRE
jgi:hypothetical protein